MPGNGARLRSAAMPFPFVLIAHWDVPLRDAPPLRHRWRYAVPDPNGFLNHDRELPHARPIPVRVRDWHEVYPPAEEELVRTQAARCMGCGIPYCHHAC